MTGEEREQRDTFLLKVLWKIMERELFRRIGMR